MIRYKVVKKQGRRSAAVLGSADLIYKKGTIVHKHEGTVGIFVFRTRRDAEVSEFMLGFGDNGNHMILRVRAIGRGRTVKVRGNSNWLLYEFVEWCTTYCKVAHMTAGQIAARTPLSISHTYHAPKGTMVYDAVEVLD